jgi:endonuclease-3
VRRSTVDDQRSALNQRARKIIRLLKRAYPDAKCSLNHSNAFELLIATILSAQCTDARVNIALSGLARVWWSTHT